VRLWDIEQRQNTLVLKTDDVVTSVAFSPDAKYIAAGSMDGRVHIWDVPLGRHLETLGGLGDGLATHTIAVSPDGKSLLSGNSLDKTVKMWELATYRGLSTLVLGGDKCVRTFAGYPVSSFRAFLCAHITDRDLYRMVFSRLLILPIVLGLSQDQRIIWSGYGTLAPARFSSCSKVTKVVAS